MAMAIQFTKQSSTYEASTHKGIGILSRARRSNTVDNYKNKMHFVFIFYQSTVLCSIKCFCVPLFIEVQPQSASKLKQQQASSRVLTTNIIFRNCHLCSSSLYHSLF